MSGSQDALNSILGGGSGSSSGNSGSADALNSILGTKVASKGTSSSGFIGNLGPGSVSYLESKGETPAQIAQEYGATPPHQNAALRIIAGIGGAVVHAPAGVFNLAKDTGTVFYRGGENIVNDVAGSHLGPASGWRSTPGHPGIVADQSELTQALNRLPSYRGIVQGAKQTGNEIVHPTQIARNYSKDPVGAFLNDAANLVPVLHGAGAVAEAGARGAETGALATAAKGAKAGAETAQKAAMLPIAGPMKLPRLAGNAAFDRAMSTIQKGEKPGPIVSNVARLSEQGNKLSTANLEGAAAEQQTRDAINRVELKVAKILPDRDEQAAWITHLQGESPAYHLLQTHMPDSFDQFVAEHTGGTLTPRAAHMAADIAAGRNPELAERIAKATDEFNKGLGNSGLGSLAKMREQFETTPGHEWQAEGQFAPNPIEMQRVGDKGTRLITGALKSATKLRQQATEDRQVADALREARYGRGADQAEAATSRLRAAQGYPTGGPESNELPATTPAPPIRPGSPVRQAILGERAAQAEKNAATQGRLAHPDYVVGRAEDRARASDAAASKAEARLSYIQDAARRADVAAETKLTNAPSRLRPALSTNQAVASEAIKVVNQLHAQGLHDSAHQLLDELDRLPQSVKQLEAAQRDASYVPHTQEGKPASNAFSPKNKQGLVQPHTAGSLKYQREGSQFYDRSVAGVAKGLMDRAVMDVRLRTAEKVSNLPFVARLNRGPLEGVGTKEEAMARGYVPWVPGSLFDKAGRIPELDEYLTRLGDTTDTPFIPKPLFDAYRNYFAERRGELLRTLSHPANKAFVLTRLAFSPALITGRLVGHTMLAMAHGGHDPVNTYRAIAEAYRQWKATGEGPESLLRHPVAMLKDIAGPGGERSFTFLGPDAARVPKASSTEAEVDRMRTEQKEAQARANGTAEPLTVAGRQLPAPVQKGLGVLSKVNAKLDQAASATLHAAAFWDNLNRSAFYMIEKSKGASDEDAVRAALRATGEFDRLTPTERDYFRSIIPFWAWHREITRIAAHLAEDNPIKVAWLLHLGNLDNKENGPLEPSFDQGSVSVGNDFVSPGFLVPFTEAGTPFGGGLFGVGKDLGPLPRLLVGQLGLNPTSGKQWYEPPGTPTRFGMPMGPGVLKQLAALVPETNLIGGLTGGNKIDRYANGQPVLTKAGHYRPQPTGQSLGQTLLGLAGVTTANKELEQEKQLQSIRGGAKTGRASAKSLGRYLARKAAVFGRSSTPASGGGSSDALSSILGG